MVACHTPPPWAVGFPDGSGIGGPGEGGAYILAPDPAAPDHLIYVVSGGRDDYGLPRGVTGRTDEEMAANARLIAAAPDLLAALQAARADLMKFGVVPAGKHGAGDPEITQIDAALRKAGN